MDRVWYGVGVRDSAMVLKVVPGFQACPLVTPVTKTENLVGILTALYTYPSTK